MQRKLRLLAMRACTSGVLDATQLGVTVHALDQLDALRLTDANQLELVRALIGSADLRSQANVLHTLARQARATCDVRTALPDLVTQTLREVQEELSEHVDELSAPEAILAMEAVMKLLPYGGVVDGLLLRELQDRTLALVSAVERPVDLIGITRVVVEGLQLPNRLAPSDSDDVHGEDEEEDDMDVVLLARAGRRGGRNTSDEAVGKQWGEAVLRPLLQALEARVEAWRSQDLMSLLDALVLRGGERASSASRREPSGLASSATSAAAVPDMCRPFIGRLLLDKVSPAVPQLSPSQCAAWLLRLVRLGYHREARDGAFKALFLRLVDRLVESSTRSAMSPSQLSTSACALATVLTDDPHMSTPPTTDNAPPALSPQSSLFSTTDTERCLRAFLLVCLSLCTTLDTAYGKQTALCHSEEAARAAVIQVLPVLSALPESAIVACARRGLQADEAGAGAGLTSDAYRTLASTFPGSLRWCCSFVLRHFHSLLPREKVHAATVAFHWNVYSPSGPMGNDNSTASLRAATVLAALAESQSEAKHASTVGAPVRGKDETNANNNHHQDVNSRQLVALCGLVQQSMSCFNTLDSLQILNEAAAAMYAGQTASTSSRVSSYQSFQGHEGMLVRAGMDSGATMHALLHTLHTHLQQNIARSTDGITTIPTGALVRYLTSLSKLNVRAKAPYYTLLDELQTRTLTSFELVAVLGVMSRHHLHRPTLVKKVVRQLPELTSGISASPAGGEHGSHTAALQPTQKAMLLKFLGQAGAQRFVRAPSSPYFEAGVWFADADEACRLSFLELIFTVNGLTALRQFTSPSLAWALQAMATKASSPAERGTPVRTEDYARLFQHVRSATTQAELLSALVHIGGPLVSPALVEAAAQSLRHALLQSRSLFVDMARLADVWPLLPVFLTDLHASVTTHGARTSSSAPAAAMASVTKALTDLQQTCAVLVRARLLDIANPSTLRRNSFLFSQIANGVLTSGAHYFPEFANTRATAEAAATRGADTFRLAMCVDRLEDADVAARTLCDSGSVRTALPGDTSESLELLVTNMDLQQLNAVLSNPAQLVDCAVVGLFLLTVMDHATPPRLIFRAQAVTLLQFVRKHVEALRVKDALLVWRFTAELLTCASTLSTPPRTEGSHKGVRDRNGHMAPSVAPSSAAPGTSRGERVYLAWCENENRTVVPMLRDLRDACRTSVLDEKALPKLSPVEKRLLDTELL